MQWYEIVLGIVLIITSVALVAMVLLQEGRQQGLSGAIAGGAETFFGNSKGSDINKKLSVVTTIIAIVFVILVIAMYLVF